jgi:hypothetical protein
MPSFIEPYQFIEMMIEIRIRHISYLI